MSKITTNHNGDRVHPYKRPDDPSSVVPQVNNQVTIAQQFATNFTSIMSGYAELYGEEFKHAASADQLLMKVELARKIGALFGFAMNDALETSLTNIYDKINENNLADLVANPRPLVFSDGARLAKGDVMAAHLLVQVAADQVLSGDKVSFGETMEEWGRRIDVKPSVLFYDNFKAIMACYNKEKVEGKSRHRRVQSRMKEQLALEIGLWFGFQPPSKQAENCLNRNLTSMANSSRYNKPETDQVNSNGAKASPQTITRACALITQGWAQIKKIDQDGFQKTLEDWKKEINPLG